MKRVFSVIFLVFIIATSATAQQGSVQEEASATVSRRQNDFALCGQPFYDILYVRTVKVFADGASHVSAEEDVEQVFALVRWSAEFSGNTDTFVDHIRNISGQQVQSI